MKLPHDLMNNLRAQQLLEKAGIAPTHEDAGEALAKAVGNALAPLIHDQINFGGSGDKELNDLSNKLKAEPELRQIMMGAYDKAFKALDQGLAELATLGPLDRGRSLLKQVVKPAVTSQRDEAEAMIRELVAEQDRLLRLGAPNSSDCGALAHKIAERFSILMPE